LFVGIVGIVGLVTRRFVGPQGEELWRAARRHGEADDEPLVGMHPRGAPRLETGPHVR
jgi:hypothetical protein